MEVRKFAFIISPWGNGPDCFRTWEGLVLGAIVLMLRNGSPVHEELFSDLPVIFLNNWTEVTAENLRQWKLKYSGMFDPSAPLLPKLTWQYWSDRIANSSRTAFV